ncbi:MAG: DUF1294 domain-containing protein [Bacilli bacterium]|nr:DUF1294 domain-containing protein [Bacilli bacterium]
MNDYLFYYLFFENLLIFILFGIDKFLAITKKRRISEFCLLFFILIGGGFGSLFGMLFFHHKTKHPKFIIFVTISIIVWMIFLIKKLVI